MKVRGFTLLEMLVVLLIMVALATLAFSSVETLDERMRYNETTDTLQKIEHAVKQTYKDSEGKQITTGFLPDIGRMPRKAGNDPLLEMKELWDGTGLPTPSKLQAPITNPLLQYVEGGIIKTKNRNSVITTTGPLQPFDNKDVSFSFGGWKGPYLKLGVGKTVLTDGWGNAFKTEFTSDGQLKKITSLGADNRVGEINGDSYSKDISVDFTPVDTNARYTVTGVINAKNLSDTKHLIPQLQIFQASEDLGSIETTAYLFQISEIQGSACRFTLTNRRPGKLLIKVTQEKVEPSKNEFQTIVPKDNPVLEVMVGPEMPGITIQLD